MKKTSSLILFLLCAVCACAQQESSAVSGREIKTYAAIESSEEVFLDSLYTIRTGTECAFINGHDYFPYHYRATHKPLLFSGKERTGSITVSGRKYNNIVLQYDTYTDQVIFPEIDNNFGDKTYQIAINKDILSAFTLFFRDDTLRFKYLGGSDTGTGLPPGFYEVAYDGPSRYLVKHRSVVHQRNGIDEYFYSPVGYVMTSNGYQKATSTKKFILLFGIRSTEMKRIIERRNLNIRKAGKREIINALKLYDAQASVSR